MSNEWDRYKDMAEDDRVTDQMHEATNQDKGKPYLVSSCSLLNIYTCVRTCLDIDFPDKTELEDEGWFFSAVAVQTLTVNYEGTILSWYYDDN